MEVKFQLLQHDVTCCPETWGMQEECALFYRIYFVLGGEAYYSDALQEQIRLEKGILYILPVMHPYSMWQNVKDPLYVQWFHVEMDLETVPEMIKYRVDPETEIFYVLKALETLNGKADLFAEAEQMFKVLLMLLDRELSFVQIYGRKMQSIQEYIESHIQDAVSVQKLAEYAGMERSYFSKYFKKYFSMPPQQYLFAKKMHYAARCLIRGESIKEICRKIGYADEKTFSRAFHRYMEVPPGEYRKKHIEQP